MVCGVLTSFSERWPNLPIWTTKRRNRRFALGPQLWRCPIGPRLSAKCLLMCQLPDPLIAETVSALKEKAPLDALSVGVEQPLLQILSLLKYQISFAELQWREKQGDRKASAKVVDIMHLYDRWVHEVLPPGGVRSKTNGRIGSIRSAPRGTWSWSPGQRRRDSGASRRCRLRLGLRGERKDRREEN